jgi:hypothetical protein
VPPQPRAHLAFMGKDVSRNPLMPGPVFQNGSPSPVRNEEDEP